MTYIQIPDNFWSKCSNPQKDSINNLQKAHIKINLHKLFSYFSENVLNTTRNVLFEKTVELSGIIAHYICS